MAQARCAGFLDDGEHLTIEEADEQEDVELGPDTARCDSGWFAELTRKLGGTQEVCPQGDS